MVDRHPSATLISGLLLFQITAVPPANAAYSALTERAFHDGLEALYNARYDKAEAIFQNALESEPHDPTLHFGLACVDWWRLENTFPPPGSPEEKHFRAEVKSAIKEARTQTQGPNAPVAYLCLGGAYGLQGRWEAAHHHWMGAFFAGRKAYVFQKRALQLDPQLYDASLGVGAFDYFASTLPKLYRVLTFLHFGNRATGLQELETAAERSMFSRTAAQMLLIGIEWNFENRSDLAWSRLEILTQEYPRSPFMAFLRLIGLYRLKDYASMKREARVFLERVDRKEPYYEPTDRLQGLILLGLSDQEQGAPSAALENYGRAQTILPIKHPVTGLLYLLEGECHDLLGQRSIAVEYYKNALRAPRLWAVHLQAQKLLKNSFLAGDDPLPHEFKFQTASSH